MSDEKNSPDHIDEKDLDDAKGGYSVWIGGSVKETSVKPEYQVASTQTVQDTGTAQGRKGNDTLIFPNKED
ncbi:MAG: hypothetical protein AAFR17_16820 [Pseudomonadota bacterium]